MKTAAIIPAYNEKERISSVIEAVLDASSIDEVVVVSDGSTDGTDEKVASFSRVKLIRLEPNRGKAGAMRAGAMATQADIVMFLDADLLGLDGQKVDSIIEPVISGKADMAIGVFRGGRFATDWAQVIAPYISGQRALYREVFLNISGLEDVRMGVETAITKYAHSYGLRVARIPLSGCTHCMKEEKLGIFKGFAARLKMYADIGRILLDRHDFKRP